MAGGTPGPDDPPCDADADWRWMGLALEEAESALRRQEVPVGCVFIDDATKEVLAVGSNRTNETRNATRHAELVAFDALRDADAAAGRPPRARLTGVTVVVTCEPCLMCAAALGALSPTRVLYGCANDRFGGCGSVAGLDSGVEAATAACGGGGGEEGGGGGPARAVVGAFPATGGVRAGEAVALLQAFYESGNPGAPVPRRPVVPVEEVVGGGGG